MQKFEAAHEVALENDRQAAEERIEATRIAFETWKVEFEAAHEVAMAAAGGRTTTMTRDRGQSNDSEDERESGQGFSQGEERSEETPPDTGGEG